MRQLLTQLYVTSEDAYLSLDGENVVVSRQKTEIGRVPLHTLEGIVCFSRSGASPALMGKCAAKGIDLCFFSPYGQFWRAPSAKSAAMSCCGRPSTASPTAKR